MKNRIKTTYIGQNYIWKEEIDSTNEEAKRLGREGAPQGTVEAAAQQTKGRGRRGRRWESPGGDNIYLSILLKPKFEPSKASMLTLMAALAAAEALEQCCQVSCQIKWPNDLVINQKKACGILTEMLTDHGGISSIIVGIGINVNTENFPKEIDHMATSLKKETGKEQDFQEIIASLLEKFEEYYEIFMEHLSLRPFMEEYNKRLINAGQQVQILTGSEVAIRTAHGINENGALIVSDERGRMEKIISGEVSVRGLYGYV